jgi:hypothetical protein
MKGFRENGAQVFGTEHPLMVQEIARFDLGLTFLVAGFEKDAGALFSVDPRGRPRFDKRGFDAIGSGEAYALAALSLQGHHAGRSTQEAIYAVLSAKIAAEQAPGVGKRTTIGVLHPYTLIDFVSEDVVAVVRRTTERRANEPMPDDVATAIQSWWVPYRDAMAKEHRAQMEHSVKQLRDALATRSTQKRSTRDRKASPPSPE